jgi:hypothetical protein
MLIPIPDDWDGEDWRCIEVQWPSSPAWIAILIGLLSTAARGRFWDERSGSIIDVQEIGKAIFDANFPLVACGEQHPGNGNEADDHLAEDQLETIGRCYSMDCSIPYGTLRWSESGVLQYRYCGEWYNVSGTPAGEPTDDGTFNWPPDTDYDETETFPCGMATAVVDVLFDLGEYIWDNADNSIPFLLINAAQNHVHLDLNNTYTLAAVNQALIMKGAVIISGTIVDLEKSDVIGDDFSQFMKCRLLPYMGESSAVERDDLYSAVSSAINAYYPWSESGNNVFITAYWDYIRRAIGSGNLVDIAKSGSLVDGDCDCPSGPTQAGQIFFTGATAGPVSADGTAVEVAEVADGGRRFHFQIAGSAGTFRSMRDFDAVIAGAEAGDTVTIRVYNDPSVGAYMPSREWQDYTAPAPVPDWFDVSLGGTSDIARVNNASYMEWTNVYDAGETPSYVRLEDMRFYPSAGGVGDWRTAFWLEVVAVNGVYLTPLGP